MRSTNININITQHYRVHKIKEIYALLLQTNILEYIAESCICEIHFAFDSIANVG